MAQSGFEQEREDLQAVLYEYERGAQQFDVDAKGNLERETTAERIASVKRRIAFLDDKIARSRNA